MEQREDVIRDAPGIGAVGEWVERYRIANQPNMRRPVLTDQARNEAARYWITYKADRATEHLVRLGQILNPTLLGHRLREHRKVRGTCLRDLTMPIRADVYRFKIIQLKARLLSICPMSAEK